MSVASKEVSKDVVPVTPEYWAQACAHLAKKDRVMKKLIPQFGDAILETRGDAFVTLARSIVGQQISVKAAQSVWDKFSLLTKKLTPAAVLKLKVDDMRAAGLSVRKVEYLVDLALHFSNGAVHVKDWQAMDDEAIIDELVARTPQAIAEVATQLPTNFPEDLALSLFDGLNQAANALGRTAQPVVR